MSDDLSAVKKFIEEILIDLMDENVLSIGVHASSTGGLKESPSTGRRSVPSRTATEKRSKHCDDLENAKHILSIFPIYNLPLDGVVSCDSIPRDFEYTLITAYLQKGIHVVGP
jgi:hypothetical protein